MIPAIIGIIAVVAIAIAIAGIYNNMVTLRNRIDNAWQNIDTQLQRRNDMIPNPVSYTHLHSSTLSTLPLPSAIVVSMRFITARRVSGSRAGSTKNSSS